MSMLAEPVESPCVCATLRMTTRAVARLYDQVRVSLPFPCDLCVTEVATRNQVSLRAHERMGFEPVSTYSDGREDWVVVAWDLSRPAGVPAG